MSTAQRPTKPPSSFREGGLRQKLMQLSMSLTLIAVILLIISLVSLLWLRQEAIHLVTTRAPAVEAALRAEIGLQT